MQSIRPMSAADIPDAEAILQAAHRMEIPFANLLRRNLQLTPNCWWLLDQGNKTVGVVGAIDYEKFAHLGLMAIHPDAQLIGAGSKLLSHALHQLESLGHNSITLYSTDAGLAFYPRHGFRWHCLSTEWQLRKRAAHVPTFRILPSTDFARIAEWDSGIFGGNREPLLRALNEENPNRTLIAVDETGNFVGFLLAQAAVIGPFAAATPQAAADLLQHALTLNYEHPHASSLPTLTSQGNRFSPPPDLPPCALPATSSAAKPLPNNAT